MRQKLLKFFFFLLLSCFSQLQAQGQSPSLDSLQSALQEKSDEMERYFLMAEIAWEYQYSNAQKALDWAEKAKRKAFEIGDSTAIADAYVTLGGVNYATGNYANSLTFFFKALSVAEAIDNEKLLAKTINNIGNIYYEQQDLDKALEYYNRVYSMHLMANDSAQMGSVMNNIGEVYRSQGKYKEALDAYSFFLKTAKANSNLQRISIAYNNIGETQLALGNVEEAKELFLQSLEIEKKLASNEGKAYALVNLALVSLAQERFDLAEDYALKGLEAAKTYQGKERIKTASGVLAATYEKKGNYQKAYEYFQLFAQYRDSLFNAEKSMELGRLEAEMQLQKEINQNRVFKEREIKNLEYIERQKNITYIVSFFLVLFFLMAVLLIRSNKKVKSSNTLLKNRQEEIAKINMQLLQKNDRLEDLNRERESLMSIVAHDLKSPLNKINGLLHIIELSGPLNESQKESINLGIKVADGGRELIDELIYFASVEEGKVKVFMEKLTLNTFLKDLSRGYKELAAQKNIEISCELPADIIIVKSDRKMLGRILDNLVSNAIKFSAFHKEISIVLSAEETNAVISVCDQGPGIAEEEKKLLFRRFQRLSNRPTNGENSTGLGLSIVKMLLEKINGEIRVTSKVSEGTTFSVLVPLSTEKF